jgi:hypothetical protein
MLRTIETRHLGLGSLPDSPPRWAVVTVKCCVVGILVLPVTTLAWLAFGSYWPERAESLAPTAFVVSIGLGLALMACASILTSIYPPVRRTAKR